MDKAHAAALATLRARAPQEIAEMDAACAEAKAHRLREESRRRPAHAADGGGSV